MENKLHTEVFFAVFMVNYHNSKYSGPFFVSASITERKTHPYTQELKSTYYKTMINKHSCSHLSAWANAKGFENTASGEKISDCKDCC